MVSARHIATPTCLLLLAALAFGCASEAQERADLLPLSPATARVNELLRVELRVDNPSGAALDFSFSGPELPGLTEATSISGGSSGGEFRWTPLASHVGTHEITFTVGSPFGDDSESVLITVAPAASAAPVFLRPGAGGTYDLIRDPCVRFDIEVRDDDSEQVTIRFRGQAIEGARLEQTGPRRGEVEWCPSLEQTDLSDRWTFLLEADDGDHAPTPHDYLVVLRTSARDDCEGEPPSINVVSPGVNERVQSASGYRVVIEIFDDVGIRGAPLLYYSTVEPDDPISPDITELDQTTFVPAGSVWEAMVPPLGLQPGAERPVYFLASVTDNDDPNGTTCDHRTDTSVRSFVAVGPASDEQAADCELCNQSSGCESGICAAAGGGTGVCLPACNPGDDCGSGQCVGTLTVEGGSPNACGDRISYCEGGGGSCDDDDFEDNDSAATAVPLQTTSADAAFCDDDPDFYSFVASDGADSQELEISVTGFDPETRDLDLELLDASFTRLDISAGLAGTETVNACVTGGTEVIARVFSVVNGSDGPYQLTISESVGDCCINDDFEPDPIGDPRPIPEHGNFDGVICPGDADHHAFTISGPTRLSALIVFTHAEADLDLYLYDPLEREVAFSVDTDDDEEIEVDLVDPGTYVLRVEVYGDGSTDYLGQILLEELPSCATTDDCPIGTVCRDGLCGDDSCEDDLDCPTDHICPLAGPDGAPRHCAAPCEVNGDCRDEGPLDEACKRFEEGRGCGQRGSGQNGEPCDDFSQCGGQRACLDWPSGYCGRGDCANNGDCESDTFCSGVDGLNVCVRRCGGAEPACRTADGYTCAALTDTEGNLEAGCVPQ